MGHLDFLHLDARNRDLQQAFSSPKSFFLSNSFQGLSLHNKILTKIESYSTKPMSQPSPLSKLYTLPFYNTSSQSQLILWFYFTLWNPHLFLVGFTVVGVVGSTCSHACLKRFPWWPRSMWTRFSFGVRHYICQHVIHVGEEAVPKAQKA